KRITMTEAVLESTEGKLREADLHDPEKLRRVLLESLRGDDVDRGLIEQMSVGELIGARFEEHVEHRLVHPTFVTQFPGELSPRARTTNAAQRYTDRFELYVAGREIANAFSE